MCFLIYVANLAYFFLVETLNQSLITMNRRDAMRLMTATIGSALASSVLAETAMRYPDSLWQTPPEGYNTEEMALLAAIADTIIPTTVNSPGAATAGVQNVIPIMLRDCYSESEQKVFAAGLVDLEKRAQASFKCSFVACWAEQRTELLQALEQAFIAQRGKPDSPPNFFKIAKDLTLVGYFTSEIGATQALRHVLNPGRSDADIPYTKGEKSWSM